jgi:nucleotide-binding universal stress UspA family protein
MYKNILATVNEFTNSEIASHYAIAMAKACEAKLALIFVSEERKSKDVFKHAESSLERLFLKAEKEGVDVKSITEKGDPFTKIIEFVRNNSTDIVFIATRREDVHKRFFIKTLSRKLMLKLPCSVAMVRVVRMARIHPKNILVPVGSHMTHIEERAFFAAKLALVYNSRITVFHLYPRIKSLFDSKLYFEHLRSGEYLNKNIVRFVKYLEKYNLNIEKRVSYGSVSRAITIEAAQRRNDLIIMGASERGIFRSMVYGNPVEEVLRETPCNLIVLRPNM